MRVKIDSPLKTNTKLPDSRPTMARNAKFLSVLVALVILIPVFWTIIAFSFKRQANAWGFFAHKKINRMAVFILPPDMVGFYKKHIEYITEHAIDPDKRSHGVEGEAEKHYIDIDHYGISPFDSVPRFWKDAVRKYSEDTLKAYGINPWHIQVMVYRLTESFKDQDVDRILFNSANIGHYIADATVPLHTTHFYDGKTPDQKGIHAFWESRLPELFADDFDFFVGRAQYINKPLDFAWELVKESHYEVDTVLTIQVEMEKDFPSDKKYSFEDRGAAFIKVFSREYSEEFDKRMQRMIERKMRTAIFAVGSLWYTAWVNAGQPDLSIIESAAVSEKHKKELEELEYMWKNGKPKGRPNPE